MKAEATPEVLVECTCDTGENPLWHATEKRVYWVDIPAGILYRHTPGSGSAAGAEQFAIGAAVGGFTRQADGALLLFMARGAVALWRDGQLKTVLESLPGEEDSRFNDVIADPQGRVFCGTMSTPQRAGSLYRLDTDGSVTKVVEDVGTSNGLGFTPDRRSLYHTDSRRREIYRFDYDEASGAISDRRVFVKVPEGEGVPDGLTVDAEGCVWSARWGGSRVVRYSPEGRELARFMFPTRNVSSLTFGGPDGADIFITTAGGHKREENGPTAGCLYHLDCGVKGVPEFCSRVTR